MGSKRGPPIFALAVFVGLAWSFGQDVNWDLQNYHAYDAFALLHWRYGQDTAPAGPQTYLNPVPYLPPYLFGRAFGPLASGLAEAALQSCSALALWLVARRVAGTWPAALATVAGASAAMALAEIGTSMDDLLLAAFPLLAIRLALAGEGSSGIARYAWAGLLTGMPAGLKLTMVTLCVALVVALLVLGPDRRWRAVLASGAGMAAGFLLTGGLWAAHLWVSFGNPFFPFLNNLFRSAAAAPTSFGDPRFHFKGVLHAIAIPFGVAAGRAPTAETPFCDLRDLASVIVAPIVLVSRRPDQPRLRFLSAYLLAGFAAWLVLCPIERYAVTLDMLGGAFVVLAAASAPRFGSLAALAVSILLVATTRRADFFHRPWAATYAAHPPSSIRRGDVALLLGVPLGYWVAASPHPDRAVDLYPGLLTPGGKLAHRLDATLATAGDRLRSVALDINPDPGVRFEMGLHGVALAPPCERAASMVWVATVFCRAVHVGSRAYGASDLSTGDQIAFSAKGDGWIYEIDGWDATEADGTWATGPHARLAFVDRDRGPTVADIMVSAVLGAPPRVLLIDAAGRSVERRIGPDANDVLIEDCVGAARAAGDVTIIDFSTSDWRSMAALGLGPETRPLAFRMHGLVLRPAINGECGAR